MLCLVTQSPMKKFLIFVSLLMAGATTGLLAETVTAPVPAPSAPAQSAPAAKKTSKHKHAHKKRHKKKAGGT